MFQAISLDIEKIDNQGGCALGITWRGLPRLDSRYYGSINIVWNWTIYNDKEENNRSLYWFQFRYWFWNIELNLVIPIHRRKENLGNIETSICSLVLYLLILFRILAINLEYNHLTLVKMLRKNIILQQGYLFSSSHLFRNSQI